jgi:dihydroorotase
VYRFLVVDTVLTNAKAYYRQEITECSLAIEEGKIFKIGKETNMPYADEKINLHQCLLLPGLIDSHVHLRDEKKAYKETFQSGTMAAAAGGVTTVLDMPNNSPTTMNVETLRNRMKEAEQKIFVNVGFYSEFPNKTEEIENIAKQGAVGLKLFLAEQVGGLNIDDDQMLLEAFKKAGEMGVNVSLHAEDHNLLKAAVEKQKIAKQQDLRAFLKAHDERVEVAAIRRIIKLKPQLETTRFHFCHLSTEKGLEEIKGAKKRGYGVTCEVTPHHLLLSLNDYELFGFSALTMPPLRTKNDSEALLRGIEENSVDLIGSDHAPHAKEEKKSETVWDIHPGIPGLETTLPLILTMIHKNKLSLHRAVQLLSEKPAEIFGLTDRGIIEQGKKADFVAVDYNMKFKIDSARFYSKAKNTPFNGWEVIGKPVKTFVNGKLVMEDEKIVTSKKSGVILRRKNS